MDLHMRMSFGMPMEIGAKSRANQYRLAGSATE